MRHHLAGWVPAGLAAVLGACATDAPPTDSYELSGYVREQFSGDPVSGATVRFTSDTLYTEATRTGADGLYEMVVRTDTPFGQVRGEKAGFTPSEATVYFDAPERRIDLALRPATAE